MQGLAVSLVPIGALAALGGAHPSAPLPILAAAVAAFLASRARVGVGDHRALDLSLAALAGAVALQIVPLPAAVVAALSPHLAPLRAALHLDPAAVPPALSADPRLTRAGLASLLSTLLVFWAARETFGRGGVRAAARVVAWAGFVLVLVTFVQRATSPTRLLWTWDVSTPGAQPFGPFVNRNHLASWLLMGAALTAGYLVSHAQAIDSRHASLRLRVRDWLADGNGLLLLGALLVMLLGLFATLSRAAMLGAAAALALAALRARPPAAGRPALAVTALAAVMGLGLWWNRDGLAQKFDAATAVGRAAIWRETLPIARDFWIAGTGVGTFGPVMVPYQRTMRDLHFNQAHSEYVQAAAEGGLLVLVPLAAAAVAGLRLARRRLAGDLRVASWLRIGAAAGLTGLAVQSLFETGLRVPANALLAALLAAILLHERRER